MNGKHEGNEHPFPSTRWVYIPEKIFTPPEAPSGQRAEGAPPRLCAQNPRDKLTATIKFRGGSEAWIELDARGRKWRVPGHASILDVVLWMNSDGRLGPPR